MNKQELIEKIKKLPYNLGPIVDTMKINRAGLIKLIEQLDEPQEVEIPMFVADFITEQKKLGHTLSYSIDACMSDRVAEWYWENSELFALSWVNGYTVEKEKRYLVKMKGVSGYCRYLNKALSDNKYFFASENEIFEYRTKHTKKELVDDGFGEVFTSPLFEVKEVEG